MISLFSLSVSYSNYLNNSFVFISELSSPRRTSEQTYIPPGEASTSGRDSSPERVIPDGTLSYERHSYLHSNGRSAQLDSTGLFYEENGDFKPVHPGIPLISNFGFIIGRGHNGIVLPVYNNNHQIVAASGKLQSLHSVLSRKDAEKLGVWKEIPETLTPPRARNGKNERRQNPRGRN